jgi:hypothetical protein
VAWRGWTRAGTRYSLLLRRGSSHSVRAGVDVMRASLIETALASRALMASATLLLAALVTSWTPVWHKEPLPFHVGRRRCRSQ